MKRSPLTVEGAARLSAELDQLKAQRPIIVEAIAEARAHGDLKENAEYHAAREQQGMNEARINQIESTLGSAEIIDSKRLNAGSRIVFGAHLELVDQDTDEELRYQIVGDLEADLKANKISVSSPIARALIGKEEGDVVDIHTPGGKRSVEVLSVRYE
jgi:transcription elongation factor GreA